MLRNVMRPTNNKGRRSTTCTAAVAAVACLRQNSPLELIPLRVGFELRVLLHLDWLPTKPEIKKKFLAEPIFQRDMAVCF